jgi:hypothetical protein
MQPSRTIIHTMLFVVLAASPILFSADPAAAAAEKKKSSPPSASAQSAGRTLVASGAVEDSQQACLARIPKGATAGQLMLAEQSCKRDQQSRQAAQSVPGR